jgi:putative ABC transport system ATP-binding protein
MAIGDILVDVQAVAKHYGEGETRVDALRQVDLQVRAGEVIALLGPSGSGKTTLLNIIGCILDPSSGRVVLDGDPVFDGKWLRSDLRRLRLDKIGFIFQAHNLLPFLTAGRKCIPRPRPCRLGARKGKGRAKELLDYLEVGHRAPVKPALLSGGEAQRVAIARALANRPRIILADEPTAALDSKRAQLVMDLLRKLAAEQEACILAVTHDEKIFDRFDRLIHLRDGWILTEFGADQLMQMLKVCGQQFFRTHNHQSGIFDLTQNVICGFFWDISLCNYSFSRSASYSVFPLNAP